MTSLRELRILDIKDKISYKIRKLDIEINYLQFIVSKYENFRQTQNSIEIVFEDILITIICVLRLSEKLRKLLIRLFYTQKPLSDNNIFHRFKIEILSEQLTFRWKALQSFKGSLNSICIYEFGIENYCNICDNYL